MVSQALGQMAAAGYTPDFSDLNVSFNATKGEGFGADRLTGKHMYWRKPMNDPRVTDEGYIVTGSATPVELVRQLDKGFQPLRMFGEFQLWNPHENWRVTNEPYRRIFQRPQGLLVFPLAQIIEHQWHLIPPYAGIQFPQLAGIELTDIRCIECRRWFTSPELLSKHRSVAHRQTAGNTALGESIAKAVSTMNQPLAEALAPMMSAMTAQAEALSRISERLALSDQERQGLMEMLAQRVDYRGHQGVPPAPPQAPAPEGGEAQPIDAAQINVQPTTGSEKPSRGRQAVEPQAPEGNGE